MQYVLASASPRRRELLSQILDEFEVVPARSKEKIELQPLPEQTACLLAERKCEEVFAYYPNATVIGCDTIVVLGNEILGKPKDKDDATATLKKLSGKTHNVITGVCVRNRYNKFIDYERTEVTFNHLTDDFIRDYVASGSPMDKAGSYGIQDGGLVREYFGSYTNVVGLPVALVKRLIGEVDQDV